MNRCLFVVEDTFLIAGRGLVVVPGIVPEGDEKFRIGDPVLLKRSDGSTLSWKIGGIEMFLSRIPGTPILFVGLKKEDVPIGTEVWSVHPTDLGAETGRGGI